MKTIKLLAISASIASILVSCGGNGDTAEAKKAKLEKLKAQQNEIAAEIKTLEADIKAGGISLTDKEKVVNVEVKSLEKGLYEHSIDVQGRIDGDENITIMPKGQGPVTKLLVKAGTRVRKDQVLAEIYSDIQNAQFQSLKTNCELLKEIYNRQKSLYDKGIGTEIQYLQAKANKESAEKQLQALSESVDMTRIKSPIDGVVDEVFVKVGQMASPMAPAFRIVNYNKLKVKADVAETYTGSMREGNDVQISFPDIQQNLRTHLSFKGNAIDAVKRTFGIEIALPNNSAYVPNMLTVVKVIDYKNTQAIVVPVNCIEINEGNHFVFVAVTENGKKIARKKAVTMGSTYNDIAEISSGLQAGELLITKGFTDLNDGEAIQY